MRPEGDDHRRSMAKRHLIFAGATAVVWGSKIAPPPAPAAHLYVIIGYDQV